MVWFSVIFGQANCPASFCGQAGTATAVSIHPCKCVEITVRDDLSSHTIAAAPTQSGTSRHRVASWESTESQKYSKNMFTRHGANLRRRQCDFSLKLRLVEKQQSLFRLVEVEALEFMYISSLFLYAEG